MNTLVHLGVGNFHRAHQAWYTAHAGGDWRIVGVSLRSGSMRDALARDRFDYTLVTRGADSVEHELITIIDDILVAPEHPQRVIDVLADASTRVVTITVTEKGYALDSQGALDISDPVIENELQGGPPRSVIGFLVHGLQQRQANDAGALTIISCDNLTDNGRRLAGAVRAFAAIVAPELTAWIDANIRFPNTMVDRITPSTSDTLLDDVERRGLPAAAPVETEAFSEWVIEDDFAGPIPDWESAGARLVADVSSYERRKLRLLNGSHSLLAYFGSLCGHTFVHQAIMDPEVRRQVDGFMDEAAFTLDGDAALDTDEYRCRLIERFSNPSLQHRLEQIAMDGTLKLPVRVLPVLDACQAAGQEAPHARAAIASWAVYLIVRTRRAGVIDDPNAMQIATAIATPDPVLSLLGLLPGDNGSSLVDNERLVQDARSLLARLDR